MDAISTQFKTASVLELREIIDAVAAICPEGRERASALYRVLSGEGKKDRGHLEDIIRSLSATCEKCKGVIDSWTPKDDAWKAKVDIQNVAGWRSIFTGRKPPGYLGLPGSAIESTAAPRRTKKWTDATGHVPIVQKPIYDREAIWRLEPENRAAGDFSPNNFAAPVLDRPKSWTAVDPRPANLIQFLAGSPGTSGHSTPTGVQGSQFHSHTQPKISASVTPGILAHNDPPLNNGFTPIAASQGDVGFAGQEQNLGGPTKELPRCDTCCKIYYSPQDSDVTEGESKCPECQEFEAGRTICELCYEWTLNEQCRYDAPIEGHDGEPICLDCIAKQQANDWERKQLKVKQRDKQKRRTVRKQQQTDSAPQSEGSPHPS